MEQKEKQEEEERGSSSSRRRVKHRHDGTSPLPLGMDWSFPPSQWNGRDTIWPNDYRTGWSYCITIPSWVVVPKARDMNSMVVVYRVQVGLQSPEGVTTTHTVLRDSNDFLSLDADLRKAFPEKNFPPIPPKPVTRSWAVIAKRQRSLEDWMTSLLYDIDKSRSMEVASFFELEAAARSSFQDENPQTVEESISKTGSVNLSLDKDLVNSLQKLPNYGVSNRGTGLYTRPAKLDNEDLIFRFNQEVAEKNNLKTKVKDLQEELETTKQTIKENLRQSILEGEIATQMHSDMDKLEIKSLEMELNLQRQQKLLQQEKQKSEKEKADRLKLIYEFEALYHRLRECSMNINMLINETQDKVVFDDCSSVQAAFKTLQISDDQIEALLVEAQMLSQNDSREVSDISQTDHELKDMLSKILVDNIMLQKQLTSVLHNALKTSNLTLKDDAKIPAEMNL